MVNGSRSWSIAFVFCCLVIVAKPLAASAPNAEFSVPVHTLKGYLMVVSVFVNDRGPFDFLVDTGTNTTLIDPQLARELGLEPVGRMSLVRLNKSVPVDRYFLQTFRVGAASVSHLEALAAPLAELQAIRGKIRGVLGTNFLLQFSFLLDYDQQRFAVFPLPEQAHAPEGVRVRVEIHDWRILVPVTSPASPAGTWKLCLDSAISELLVFEGRTAASGRGMDRCGQVTCLMQVATNLSRQNAASVRVRNLGIAEAHLQDVPAVVLHNELLSPSDPSDGLLPASLLRSVFFDRTDASVVFSPRLSMVATR
jgi:predicted aspartyl protease